LRDYLPGDPPKTIAWKVSARRDRLITKEFESEVPVRCTLFVDISHSVRVGPPPLTLPSPPAEGGEGRMSLTLPPPPAEGGEGRVRGRNALASLVEISAAVAQANAGVRDLTGIGLFDEQA